MAHVIVKVLDTNTDKELKLTTEESAKVEGADSVKVEVATGFGRYAVVTIVCEH